MLTRKKGHPFYCSKTWKATVTDILKEKKLWFTISESQEHIKKFRGSKCPQLENALELWYNALSTRQDINESSRVLACTPLSDYNKEKSHVIIFCVANATGMEK
ncbi:hypothetical protein RCL_jg26001.t1 [Rhizophagus clarus]|uniref:HTH CENPB-type domain-containing protein n=1 Tax=Rhizophagus clarus TaxID=94130 RepID=A0A8H3L1C6_9GLOM|nr:hypothetical protein RCL_jg26001.t1 [Rhizophagus clarus]